MLQVTALNDSPGRVGEGDGNLRVKEGDEFCGSQEKKSWQVGFPRWGEPEETGNKLCKIAFNKILIIY